MHTYFNCIHKKISVAGKSTHVDTGGALLVHELSGLDCWAKYSI